MIQHSLNWLRTNGIVVALSAFALTGIVVGATLSTGQASAAVGRTGSLPVYPADRVPADVPTSGDALPFEVVPDASGESSWGAARVNPTGGAGSLNVWFDGTSVQMSFTGNCGPNAYISSLGNARVVVSGDASGMWSNTTLCLPSSRMNTMSTPVSNASCWRDTSATVSVTGTPNHDGNYHVAITPTQRPCPGEWDQWDWSTNSLSQPSQPTVPALPAEPAPSVSAPSDPLPPVATQQTTPQPTPTQ